MGLLDEQRQRANDMDKRRVPKGFRIEIDHSQSIWLLDSFDRIATALEGIEKKMGPCVTCASKLNYTISEYEPTINTDRPGSEEMFESLRNLTPDDAEPECKHEGLKSRLHNYCCDCGMSLVAIRRGHCPKGREYIEKNSGDVFGMTVEDAAEAKQRKDRHYAQCPGCEHCVKIAKGREVEEERLKIHTGGVLRKNPNA
jgi:hypothetical protein